MSLALTGHSTANGWVQLRGSHIQEGGGNGHARGAWGSALLEEGISEEWSSALPTSLFWERRVWQPIAKLCPESQLQTPHLLCGRAESRLRRAAQFQETQGGYIDELLPARVDQSQAGAASP